MPLYVRAGAIIPMQPVMQYADECPLDQITIRIWSETGEWTLYEDDGHTFKYKKGDWATTNYRVSTVGKTIVKIGAREGEWTPPSREMIVQLVNVGEQRFQDDGTARRITF